MAMQSSVGGPTQKMWVVAKQIYIDRGSKIGNVYKGVSMNCTRAFFSWGIMNTAYEELKKVVYWIKKSKEKLNKRIVKYVQF